MRFLLDTNILLWLLAGSDRVGPETRALLADPANEVFVSAVSAWEMAIKRQLGKLQVPPDIGEWLPGELTTNSLTALDITVAHTADVEHLPPHHTDPFDRLLVAQAAIENLTLVTGDQQLGAYGGHILVC